MLKSDGIVALIYKYVANDHNLSILDNIDAVIFLVNGGRAKRVY